MRTQHFKIWDISKKKWYKPVLFHSASIDLTSDGELFMRNVGVVSQKEFELVMGTGLYDSTETELFEGDIVKTPAFIDKVVFHHGYLMFSRDENMEIIIRHLSGVKWTIIGNEYENPELLNPTKITLHLPNGR